MVDHEITCIKRPDRYDPRARVESVGCNSGTVRQRFTIDDVISRLRAGETFWVRCGQLRASVHEVMREGRPYIRTNRDTNLNDNLLSLPECP